MDSNPKSPLLYSTIKTKSLKLEDKNKLTELKKIENQFKSLFQSQIVSPTNFSNKTHEETIQQARTTHIISDLTSLRLKLAKKGKKTGKTVVRDVGLGDSQGLTFSQEIHDKTYEFPADFIPETKTQYQEKLAAATTKESKNQILLWGTGELTNLEYRIVFSRKSNPQQNQVPDSAFYFTTKEEWERTKNFLKVINVLDAKSGTSVANPAVLLQSLSKGFKMHLILKFKKLISERAEMLRKNQLTIRERKLVESKMLNNLDSNLTRILTTRIQDRSNEIVAFNNEKRLAEERRNNVTKIIQGSTLLPTINAQLGQSFLKSWKHKSEEISQIKQEDINIVFNMLEITSQIAMPVLKLIVTIGQDFPGLVKINGSAVYKRSIEYTIQCKYDQMKSYNIYSWRMFSDQIVVSEAQRALAQKNDSLQSINFTDNRFCIQFDEFELDYLDSVELKIMLFNETETLKAYHYTSLRDLYLTGKKGNNIWFGMKLNAMESDKFPLLNLRVKCQPAGRNRSHSNLLLLNQLSDTFYNFSFKFPNLTPKHARILDLCPFNWNIGDERIRNLKNHHEYSEYIRRVIHKLSKHYSQETSKQLAKLKKSAYIWAEIQDELLTFAPKAGKGTKKEHLYVTRENLKTLLSTIETQKSIEINESNDLTIPKAYNDIVSYLFKRDEWEVRPDWRHFYVKLRVLFRKGVPSQQRIHLWSEIGKTIYFIVLTEERFKEYRGLVSNDVEVDVQMSDDIHAKSKKVYNDLKAESEKAYIFAYQELEDDLEYLRSTSDVKKLKFENHIRNVCRAFIFWSRMFNNERTEEKHRFVTNYSRSVLLLCQGLLTCQSCTYLEGNIAVEEDRVFWLLISLVNYVLASYFEIGQYSLKLNKLTGVSGQSSKEDIQKRENIGLYSQSLLRSNSMRGIRSDLLLLRLLLRTNEKELYSKFNEFGLSFEYYFADYMLSLFFNLFNPGLAFRIWDIIFFEGTSFDKTRSSKMIVCVIYALINKCKEQLMEAKRSSDFKIIFELNAKFETKYGDFIKDVYNAYNTFFGDSKIANFPEEGSDSIFSIRCMNVSNTIKAGETDKKLLVVEKALEKHYLPTQEQNRALYSLVNSRRHDKKDTENDVLSYSGIKKMIENLHTKFSSENSQGSNLKNLSRGQITALHIKIHNIKTTFFNTENLLVKVSCGNQSEIKEKVNPLRTNFEVELPFFDLDDSTQHAHIEIFDDSDNAQKKKILFAKLDLQGFPLNSVTKLVLKLDEEDSEIYNQNYKASEAEISVLLDANEPMILGTKDSKSGQSLTIPDLEEPDQKLFKKIDLEKTSLPPKIGGKTIKMEEYNKYSIFSRNKYQWKERFALSYEEFIKVVKEIMPSWVHGADWLSLYNAVTKANPNKKFYLITFFVLLISIGKCSLKQKVSLLFDLVSGFYKNFGQSQHEKLPVYVMKGLLNEIYEQYMIYIPHNEIENMVDLAIKGHTCSIKKVAISGNFNIKVNYPRSILNKLSNFIQMQYNCREIHLYNKEILKMLKEAYERSLAAHPNHLMTSRNEIEITYHTDGMSHKTIIPIDQEWRIIEDSEDIPLSNKIQSKLLYLSKDIIALHHTPYSVTKKEFMDIIQKMPLINFIYSQEQIGTNETLTGLSETSLKVLIKGESVFTAVPSRQNAVPQKVVEDNSNVPQRSKNKKDTAYYIRNWDDVVRYRDQQLGKYGLDSKMAESIASAKIPAQKFNIHFSYKKLLYSLKKKIIQTVTEAADHSDIQEIKKYHSKIFNEALWDLDFDISILVNNTKEFKIADPSTSPFQTLSEVIDQISNTQHDISSVQIIFSLKDSKISDPYIEPYNQLARYLYTDNTSEWLPCKIKYKFQISKDDKVPAISDSIDGYGVVFQKFPRETIIRSAKHVALIKKIDLNELELKVINTKNYRVTTVDQSLLHKDLPFIDKSSKLHIDQSNKRESPSNSLNKQVVIESGVEDDITKMNQLQSILKTNQTNFPQDNQSISIKENAIPEQTIEISKNNIAESAKEM